MPRGNVSYSAPQTQRGGDALNQREVHQDDDMYLDNSGIDKEKKKEKEKEKEIEEESINDRLNKMTCMMESMLYKIGRLEEENKKIEEEKKEAERTIERMKNGSREEEIPFTPYKNTQKHEQQNKPPSPLTIDDESENEERRLERLLSGLSGSRSERGAKPLFIKHVKMFDGSTPFEEWFKEINIKLIAGKHSDDVKLATLVEYLSPELLRWLNGLDESCLESFNSLYVLLKNEFRDKSKSPSSSMNKIINTRQMQNEAVTTYSVRLLQAVSESDVLLDRDTVVKSFFIDGLLPEIMKKVRSKVHTSDFLQTVSVAKAEELDILRTKAAIRRVNINNSLINRKCSNASCSNETVANRSLCDSCFQEKKKNNNNSNNSYNKNNNNNNNNNKNESSKKSVNTDTLTNSKCRKCNLNFPTPGKSMCESCFNNNRNNNNNNNNNNNSVGKGAGGKKEEVDFTKYKVKYLTPDNNSSDALLWDSEKIKSENRCFYCTHPLSNHKEKEECKNKYPNYSATEVRTLLHFRKRIQPRSVRPTLGPLPP